MMIYKGLRFTIDSWKNGDQSWIGDEWEVLDYCLPLILARNLRTGMYNPVAKGHVLRNDMINVSVDGYKASPFYHPYHNAIEVPVGDLRSGDPVIYMEGNSSEIYIVQGFSGLYGYGPTDVMEDGAQIHLWMYGSCYIDDFIKHINDRTKPEFSYGRDINQRWGVVDMEFIKSVYTAKSQLRIYYRLFEGKDLNYADCSEFERAHYDLHGDAFYTSKSFIRRFDEDEDESYSETLRLVRNKIIDREIERQRNSIKYSQAEIDRLEKEKILRF